MQETLLIIHIISAATLLGGVLAGLFAGPRVAASGAEAALAWARAAGEMARKYFPPAAVLTLLTGIGLVLNSDAYDWSDAFVSIGLFVVLAGLIIGITVQRPTAGRIADAIEDQDFAEVSRQAKKAGAWGVTVAALLLIAFAAMVLRLGA